MARIENHKFREKVTHYIINSARRGAGEAERTRLEIWCAGDRTEGSNPTLFAKFHFCPNRREF